MEEYPLYGGAISTVLPKDVIDVSKIRQIPDTQEVFLIQTPSKDANLDISIIIDLLEMVPGWKDEAIGEHLKDLVEPQDIEWGPKLIFEQENLVSYLLSTHKDTPQGQYQILMNVNILRHSNIETDILITSNIPLKTPVKENEKNSYVEEQLQLIKLVSENIKIKDYGLFGI